MSRPLLLAGAAIIVALAGTVCALGPLRRDGLLRDDPRRLCRVLRLTEERRERTNASPRRADARRLPLRARAGLRRHPVRDRAFAVADRAGDRRRRRPVSSRGPERQAGQRSGHEGPIRSWCSSASPIARTFARRRCSTFRRCCKTLGHDADRTGALFITVDPERDTPAALKDYLSNFDPHLRGLTGDPAAVDAALKAYRVYAKKVPLEGRRLHDGPHRHRLPDGQGRPFRRAVQPERTAGGGGRELRGYLFQNVALSRRDISVGKPA